MRDVRLRISLRSCGLRLLHMVAQYKTGSGCAMPVQAQLRYWVLIILANSSRNCGLS
jgi:hypothetical protein